MRIVLHVKNLLLLSDFNETEFSPQIFEKYSNIKFRENLSSGSRVSSIRTDRHEEANSIFAILRTRLKLE